MVDTKELRDVPRDANVYSDTVDTICVYLQNNNDQPYEDEFNYIIKVWKIGINR